MKVVILEVCRSPEIRKKQTEALVLSKLFSERVVEYELYSNDGIWSEKVVIDKNFIELCLLKPDLNIVHLAMHGNEQGFVLRWSDHRGVGNRIAEDLLTGFDIESMKGWDGKIVVSGACSSARLVESFLYAGSKAVIAPDVPINWMSLAGFFNVFYSALFAGEEVATALCLAIAQFPEFKSYRLFSKQRMDL